MWIDDLNYQIKMEIWLWEAFETESRWETDGTCKLGDLGGLMRALCTGVWAQVGKWTGKELTWYPRATTGGRLYGYQGCVCGGAGREPDLWLRMEPTGCGHGPTRGGGVGGGKHSTCFSSLPIPLSAAASCQPLLGGGGSPEQALERLSGVENESGGLG